METTITDILKSKVVEIIIVALVLYAGVFLINRFVQVLFKRTDFLEERKGKTIESLVRSITQYTATIGFIFYVISLFVHDFGRILAGAGVAGIVIGFGAQSLIKDILAGVFLIYERQLHKGDYVTINNLFNGTVEEIGLRSLQIREWTGKLLTISNGEVRQLQNYNIDYMRITESVVISYKEDPERVYAILEKACDMLNDELRDSLKRDEFLNAAEPFQVHGIMSLNKLTRGIEFTVKGMVQDTEYFSASLAVRRVLARSCTTTMFNCLRKCITHKKLIPEPESAFYLSRLRCRLKTECDMILHRNPSPDSLRSHIFDDKFPLAAFQHQIHFTVCYFSFFINGRSVGVQVAEPLRRNFVGLIAFCACADNRFKRERQFCFLHRFCIIMLLRLLRSAPSL